MENVVLTIHLILALALVGIVLLQRSEGGGLGIGGGGGVVSGRSAATALGKITWLLAIGFICTSIALTVLARREAASSSVIDAATPAGTTAPAPAAPGSSLLPPGPSDQPLTPPRVD